MSRSGKNYWGSAEDIERKRALDSILSKDMNDELKKMLNERSVANIRYMIDILGKSVGEVEKAGGVKAGYLASISSENSTTVPTTVFLYKISKILNVSIDTLLNRSVIGLSKDEVLALQFIEKLKEKTEKENISWFKMRESDIKDATDKLMFPNGLFRMLTHNKNPEVIYESLFFPGKTMEANRAFLYAQIEEKRTVWINSLSSIEDVDDKMEEIIVYEIYIEDKNNRKANDGFIPIACSLYGEVFDDCINDLYERAYDMSGKKLFNDNERDILKSYIEQI